MHKAMGNDMTALVWCISTTKGDEYAGGHEHRLLRLKMNKNSPDGFKKMATELCIIMA